MAGGPTTQQQEVDRLLVIMHLGPHDHLAPPAHSPADPSPGTLSASTAAAGGAALQLAPARAGWRSQGQHRLSSSSTAASAAATAVSEVDAKTDVQEVTLPAPSRNHRPQTQPANAAQQTTHRMPSREQHEGS